MKLNILFILSFILTSTLCLSDDGNQLVKEILEEYKKVRSYEAEISVNVDIDYLDAPEKKGKIYYEYPKNTKIDIPGFSMLPKQGTGNFIGEILSMKSTIVLIGNQKIDNEQLTHLKVIPNDSKEIVLVDLYVDKPEKLVKKAEITTKDNGTFNVTLKYKEFGGFSMPSLVNIEFNVPTFKMPKVLAGPNNEKKLKKIQNDGENTKGKVIIKYWNYLINK